MVLRRLFALSAFAFICLASAHALAQLQIHHINVGQADGAVVITPGGKVILFDVGQDMKQKNCVRAVSYLEQLGVKQIDALFVSHYHSDHIGCIPEVLKNFPTESELRAAVEGMAWDVQVEFLPNYWTLTYLVPSSGAGPLKHKDRDGG